ncbi:MAG: hypothetical protein JO362_02565 [Streptomycetaceae bacterium]|nr:hypothetical protein [Streptomycetaceae bacterium]
MRTGAPTPLAEVIAQAERCEHRVVGMLVLGRVAASRDLTGWRPEGGLDPAYPLGTHPLVTTLSEAG